MTAGPVEGNQTRTPCVLGEIHFPFHLFPTNPILTGLKWKGGLSSETLDPPSP